MKKMFLLLLSVSCLLFSACSESSNVGGKNAPTSVYVSDGYIQLEKRTVRMFMVDGELYYDSGEISKMTPRCGTLDGGLKKRVAENEIPKNDGESNFKIDGDYFGYQSATDITKEIPIDGEWVIFKKYEDTELELDRYKYCFYIKGRLPNAEVDSKLIVLTEDENVDFRSVMKPLFSSGFDPDEERKATTFVFIPSEDKWGIRLKAQEVTNKGLTLACEQFAGNAEGQLQTGAWFSLEVNNNGKWEEVKIKESENPFAWTMAAYEIDKNTTTTWDIDWQWIYGELEPGYYRIAKKIDDFIETGNYISEIYYADFLIEE